MLNLEKIITSLIPLVQEVGREIMSIYKSEKLDVSFKKDESPVTKADKIANEMICDSLKILTPEIKIVSEEEEFSNDQKEELFWLIDPLDGTRHFISKTGQFTVNIGLIENRNPVAGIVYAPSYNELYYSYDNLAFFNGNIIHTRKVPEEGASILISNGYKQSNIDFTHHKISTVTKLGSSLKICHIARGIADIYPRPGTTMEWDTAAAHAILNAAGGQIKDLRGNTLTYNKNGYKNNGFICYGTSHSPN